METLDTATSTDFATIVRGDTSSATFTKAFVGTQDATNKEDIGTLYAKAKPVRNYTNVAYDKTLGVLDLEVNFGVNFVTTDNLTIGINPSVSQATSNTAADTAPLRCVWINGSTEYLAS
jgi:hypothetical protein